MSRPWLPAINQHERDSRAALIDRPPATTMRDVLAMTAGPAVSFIARHARSAAAAWRSYKESINDC
jgi:hypothetical protein